MYNIITSYLIGVEKYSSKKIYFVIILFMEKTDTCARLNYSDLLWEKNKVNDDNLNNSRKRAKADDKYHVHQWCLMIKWLSIDVHSLVQCSRLFINV